MIIGIPAHCERSWLPHTLQALARQSDTNFQVWVCVNQPASWRTDANHQEATAENQDTLDWLQREATHLPFPLHVIDAIGSAAPQDKHAGVGWARARIFDELCGKGDALCVSLDADTLVEEDYTAHIRAAFAQHRNALGLAVPYYHKTPKNPKAALHLLRYEIYMRYYQLSLWRVGSPYAFLPLGSAMAFRAHGYRQAGGMPWRSAGEDFYFLQRLRKAGPLMRHLPTKVYPASRISQRVPFGTGLLLQENDLSLQSSRFPFYAQTGFDLLAASFALFPTLYNQDLALPIEPWLGTALKKPGVAAKMRKVLPDEAHFVKACHERFDGLRTLQILRAYTATNGEPHPARELNLLLAHLNQPPVEMVFHESNIAALDRLRNQLASLEEGFQKDFMGQWNHRARW